MQYIIVTWKPNPWPVEALDHGKTNGQLVKKMTVGILKGLAWKSISATEGVVLEEAGSMTTGKILKILKKIGAPYTLLGTEQAMSHLQVAPLQV